jgi:RimJ/RimL family protein N-acetyltransferase
VIDDVESYLSLVGEIEKSSGVDGAGHSHPYSESEPYDAEAGRDREITRWSTPIDSADGWRRAWGLFDGNELVGNLHLAGGSLRSELHRVNLGMGIAISHRRQGGGTLLLRAAIAWAAREPMVDWIDLSVFSDNPGAYDLYLRHGFQTLGRTPDRFRVDGHSLDDVLMTLNVGDSSITPR